MHSKRNPHRPRRGWLFVTAVAATIVLAMKYRRNLRQRQWYARDIVDEASEESFPASDPPAFASGVEPDRPRVRSRA